MHWSFCWVPFTLFVSAWRPARTMEAYQYLTVFPPADNAFGLTCTMICFT